MVWALTNLVSCGVTLCNDIKNANPWMIYVVCNYRHAGNLLNEPVYLSGPGCTACETNINCNTQYTCNIKLI